MVCNVLFCLPMSVAIAGLTGVAQWAGRALEVSDATKRALLCGKNSLARGLTLFRRIVHRRRWSPMHIAMNFRSLPMFPSRMYAMANRSTLLAQSYFFCVICVVETKG